jgi:hypothetical protein
LAAVLDDQDADAFDTLVVELLAGFVVRDAADASLLTLPRLP